jgi:hypothetical protein
MERQKPAQPYGKDKFVQEDPTNLLVDVYAPRQVDTGKGVLLLSPPTYYSRIAVCLFAYISYIHLIYSLENKPMLMK